MASTRHYNRIDSKVLRNKLAESAEERTTLSFYRYHTIPHPVAFRDQLYQDLEKLGVMGRIYVASEGINGQVSVASCRLDALRHCLWGIPWLEGCRLNVAVEAQGKSFFKLNIKVRKKIVADGLDDATFDVTRRGAHLSAREVNALLDQPATIVVDMRNHYESEVGHYPQAICPDVETFREALPIVEEMLKGKESEHIVLYCTGGIRCEKASAYYLHKGFSRVFMIDGGIIEYSRQCKEQNLPNYFIGKNFVFDERLGERISADVVSHCHQCGTACDTHRNCANDACHLLFIQCPNCADSYHACCSSICRDFLSLPADEQERSRPTTTFNGSLFGKGRSDKLQVHLES